jgi:hypothetical protein
MGRRHQQRKASTSEVSDNVTTRSASTTSTTRLTSLGTTKTKHTSSLREDQFCLPVNNNHQPQVAQRPPLCRFFVLHKGNCRYGDDCAYSHELPDGASWESAAKTLVPCPFFARGECRYGAYCQLRHDEEEPPPQAVKEQPQQQQSSSTAITYHSPTADKVEPDIITCGICLEDHLQGGGDGETTPYSPNYNEIKNKSKEHKTNSNKNKFGLLSCCNHAFCFDCLMEWRKEGSQDATDRRSCPTCRKHSDYVVPSRIFPDSAPQKESIVQDYKDKLAVIPCRRFQQQRSNTSNRSTTRGRGTSSCPFGSDCFYAHLNENGDDVKALGRSMEEIRRDRERAQEERRQRRQREFRTSLLGLAESTVEDIDIMLSFLRLLDLYGYQSVQEVYWSDEDDEDDDDISDYDYADSDFHFSYHYSYHRAGEDADNDDDDEDEEGVGVGLDEVNTDFDDVD